MEAILLSRPHQSKLTAKQRRFAQAIAMGETGAGAYRMAYNTTAKPITQGQEAARLKADPKIAAQIEAFQLAQEAAAYATPAALRALVIDRLTQTAIDEQVKPAQRLRALELLGKVTEVAAFTERREIVTHKGSGDARADLLKAVRTALQNGAIDANIINNAPGNGLLEEVAAGHAHDADTSAPVPTESEGEGGPVDEPGADEATGAHPPAPASERAHPLLSNPHSQSNDPHTRPLPNQTNDVNEGGVGC